MNYRNDRRNFFAPALLALVFLVNLAPPAAGRAAPLAAPDSPNPRTVSIAEARGLPLGTVVTVDGSVTVASGAFSSSTGATRASPFKTTRAASTSARPTTSASRRGNRCASPAHLPTASGCSS